jgi:hypothetical protein
MTMNIYYPNRFNSQQFYSCVVFINGGCGPSLRLPKSYIMQMDSWCKFDLLFHESGNHFFDMDNDNVRTSEIVMKTIDYLKSAFSEPWTS